MVTLTYDDLDRISAALFFLAEDEQELEEKKPRDTNDAKG